MDILHYSLGFPPLRRGGMTKYSMDLIKEQIKYGHNVGMIWPGVIYGYNSKCKIKKRTAYKISKKLYCSSFELINPLPVPLLDGIQHTTEYMRKKSEETFKLFFKKNSFNILHIHTLMGLPIEMVEAAREREIKVVFTTHDYFGLCPMGSLFFDRSYCKNRISCENCKECNKNAISLKKIILLQSRLYAVLKDMPFLRCMRKRHLKKMNVQCGNYSVGLSKGDEKKYIELRKYYIKIFEMCNRIHFNSSLTMETYSEFFDVQKKGKVINITHDSIVDKRHLKRGHDVLNFAYLGPCADPRKGFSSLKKAMDKLYEKYGDKFKLHVYSQAPKNIPYLEQHAPYNYSDLNAVMENVDVVIVPSIWHETFGFTVLEALSFGVPVIVSENVGAKDLIVQGRNGLIVGQEVKEILKSLSDFIENPKLILEMNKYIVENQNIPTIQIHTQEIYNEIYCNT